MNQPRRRAKRPARSSAASAAKPASAARALVVVDEAPLRGAVLEEHRKLEDQAAKLRERLDLFETSEQPAYTRWEASVLGPLLTALRETERALQEKERIMIAIVDEEYFGGCSRLTAYRRVMRDLAEGPKERGDKSEDEDPWEDGPAQESKANADPGGIPDPAQFFSEDGSVPEFSAEDFDRLSASQKRDFRARYAEMALIYGLFTGRCPPTLDEILRASRQKARQEKRQEADAAPPPPPQDLGEQRKVGRIKELYRILVRRLHPDINKKQTSRDRELWHQVQAAYQQRDLESLEAAVARLEVRLNGSAGKLPLQVLRRMVKDLRAALRGLRARLAAARQHPAWDFTARSRELAAYEAKRRRAIEREHRLLQERLYVINVELDELAARATRVPKPRPSRPPRRRPARVREQDFFDF